jgi:hypothetical protein
MSQFYHLFQLYQRPNISVYEAVMLRGLALYFSRALTGVLLIEL